MELGPICLTIFVIALAIGAVRTIYTAISDAWMNMRMQNELQKLERNANQESKRLLLEKAQEGNRLFQELRQQDKLEQTGKKKR